MKNNSSVGIPLDSQPGGVVRHHFRWIGNALRTAPNASLGGFPQRAMATPLSAFQLLPLDLLFAGRGINHLAAKSNGTTDNP